MDEDTVDSADTSESLFFSKVSSHSLHHPVSALAAKSFFTSTFVGNFLLSNLLPFPSCVCQQTHFSTTVFHFSCLSASLIGHLSSATTIFSFLYPSLLPCSSLNIYSMLRHTSAETVPSTLWSMHSPLFYSPPIVMSASKDCLHFLSLVTAFFLFCRFKKFLSSLPLFSSFSSVMLGLT